MNSIEIVELGSHKLLIDEVFAREMVGEPSM